MTHSQHWWTHFFSGTVVELQRQLHTSEETYLQANFIEKMFQPSKSATILDVPCGDGRLAIELAKRGYQLMGVDISSELLQYAKKKTQQEKLEIIWLNQDMRDLPSEQFEHCFCFGNSFGYLDDSGNLNFLKAVFATVKPGGKFLLETGHLVESILLNWEQRQWYEFGDILFLIDNKYDYQNSRLETELTFVTPGKIERKTALFQLYTYRELYRLLEQVGFTDIKGYGSLSEQPFSVGSQLLYLLATKP
jgi:SAM-dependent methyltransferase